MTKGKFKIPMKGDKPPEEKTVYKCGGCGEPILTDQWVILGSGDMIHYGLEYKLKCFNAVNAREDKCRVPASYGRGVRS